MPENGAQSCIICIYFCALDIFPEIALCHGPKNGISFWHISFHIGICHLSIIFLETQCPVRYAKHRKSFLNGPSLETSRVKKEWLQIGKELLKSYPNGIKCSCGKADFDFGNTNMIAKHLIFNPKHTLKVKMSHYFANISLFGQHDR